MSLRLGQPGVLVRRHRRGVLSALVLVNVALCVSWGLQSLAADVSTPGLAFAGHGHAEVEEKSFGATLSSWCADNAQLLAVLTAIACAYMAQEENPQAAPAPPTPIEKRPDYTSVCMMSALLCAVSGMINAVAIIMMGGTVAHQTGDTSHFGRLLGIDGARFGILLLTFTIGAGVAGYSKADGEALFQRRYCPCMMAAAFGTVVGTFLQFVSHRGNWVTLPLWAFAQGIQNGVTSRFSSMPLRTTHHTGTMTDSGANLGMWLRAAVRGEATPNLQKTWLLLICLFSYAAGGVAAKAATDQYGILAALPPAATMAVLALGWLPIVPAPQKTA